MSDTIRFVHPRIVGTFVTVSLYATAGSLDDRAAESVDDAITAEFERLEQIFSVFRPDSELERWKRGELAPAETSPALRTALRQALAWQHRSGGAFHTASSAVTEVWRQATERGSKPTAVELSTATELLTTDPYTIDPTGAPVPGPHAGWVNLNAFAKGWIVDRAAEMALDLGSPLTGLTINAGGDLCHRGSPAVPIGIENPRRPYDNEPALAHIVLSDGAVATSGGARHGFRIGDEYFSHVIDPRTGLTVDHFASVTVVADDAATADVLATVIGLATVDEAIEVADGFGVATLIVLPDGSQLRNRALEQLVNAR